MQSGKYIYGIMSEWKKSRVNEKKRKKEKQTKYMY